MEIYLSKKGDKKEVPFQFPALPESIIYANPARFSEYDMLDLGTIKIPNGKDLGNYSWEGMFPGEHRKKEAWYHGKYQSPKSIQTKLNAWRNSCSCLSLKITGTPINCDVFLSDFEMTYSGAFGDYNYSINFIEARIPQITIIEPKKPNKKKEKPSTPNTNSKYTNYTVIKNDCLWNIALKKLGSGLKYPIIYNANKEMIDKRNKGKKVAKYTIYPGQILKIPV